ncbi:putative Extracellular membrane protein CFEM domain-containing protein [Seiridium cardinale]
MCNTQFWIVFTAFMIVAGVTALDSTSNSSANSSASSSSEMTPAVVLLGFPICSQSCALSSVQSAQCSLTTRSSMLDCFCTNVTAQAELSTCAQLSCDTYDAGVSMYLENAMCNAYPKESLVYVINTACIVTFALAIPVVVARCAARWKLTKRLWSDDYMSIIATVFLMTLAAVQIVCAQVGFGVHIWNFDWTNGTKLKLLSYTGQLAYIWVQITSKVAILLLYRRVFNVAGSLWFRWTVTALIVYEVLHGVIYTFVVLFQCSPVSAFWDATVTDAKCLDTGAIIFSGAIMAIAEDLALILLPIPELRKLQVSGRKRWGVAIMFAFASFGTIASIVRLRYLLALNEGHDATWNDVDVVVWSLIENLMAVVCGSLPALRPYVDPWIPRITITWPRSKGSRSSSKPKGNSTGNSDTVYSPSAYGADYNKHSYPMSPQARDGAAGQWKQSHPVRQPARNWVDVLEASSRIYGMEEGASSESETDLIIQGNRASAAHDMKVPMNSHGELRDGQEAEPSVSVNTIPVPPTVQDWPHQDQRGASFVSLPA